MSRKQFTQAQYQVLYEASINDPQAFWAEQAGKYLTIAPQHYKNGYRDVIDRCDKTIAKYQKNVNKETAKGN